MTFTVFTTVGDIIRGRFKAQIELGGDGGAAIATRYQNDANRTEPDTGVWARVTVLEADRNQADIGAALVRSRTVGQLVVQLFQPLGQGTKTLSTLACRVGAVFDRKSVSGVQFKTAKFSSGERDEGWWRVLVKVPFYFDDTDA